MFKQKVRKSVQIFELNVHAIDAVRIHRLCIDSHCDVCVADQVLIDWRRDHTKHVTEVRYLVVGLDFSHEISFLGRSDLGTNHVRAHTAQKKKSLFNGLVF